MSSGAETVEAMDTTTSGVETSTSGAKSVGVEETLEAKPEMGTRPKVQSRRIKRKKRAKMYSSIRGIKQHLDTFCVGAKKIQVLPIFTVKERS